MARTFTGAEKGTQIKPLSGGLRELATSAGLTLRSIPLPPDDLVEIRVGDCGATVPASAFQGFLEVLDLLASGHGVRIDPIEEELTTEEAARLAGVSRPHLVGLLEKGEIPFRKVGSRRRIRASDLAAYLELRQRRRKEGRVELDKFAKAFRAFFR
jgi:excisionase family DNA binding protein